MDKVDGSAHLKKREHGVTKPHSFNSISSKKVKDILSPSNKRSPKRIISQTNTINTWLNEETKKKKTKFDNNSNKSHKQELKSTSKCLDPSTEYSPNNGKINYEDQLSNLNKPKHCKDENSKKKWKKLAALGQISNTLKESKRENKGEREIREKFEENANGGKSSKKSRQLETDCKKIRSDAKREKLDILDKTHTKRKTQEKNISSKQLQRNRELHIPSTNSIDKFFCTKNTVGIEISKELSTNQNKSRSLYSTPTKQNSREIIPVRRSPRNSESPKHSLPTQLTSSTTIGLNKKVRRKLNTDNTNASELDVSRNHSSLIENCNVNRKSSERKEPRKEPENKEKETLPKKQKPDCPVDKTEHSKNESSKQYKHIDSSSRSRENNSERHRKKHKKRISEKYKSILEENPDKSSKSLKKKSRIKTVEGTDNLYRKQEKLDKFVIKGSTKNKTLKKTFTRTESSESCDFPSFGKVNKKSKDKRSGDSFKKYGVALPSIEEILKEQKDLEKYRNQIEAFADIEQQCFELPFSVKDLNITPQYCKTVLGCKHLSTKEITKAFKRNLSYISDIFHGKKYSERHERFFNNKNKSYALTIKDLTYSTSMIVFSYEQIEHAIKLLKEEFDPEDKWTPYFFQVLLPEMCLKIFMDTHEMTYEEAVKYLDTRPIVDD